MKERFANELLENDFDWKLLSYENPKREEINRAIEKAEEEGMKKTFPGNEYLIKAVFEFGMMPDLNIPAIEFLKRKLNGKIVVDLGGGIGGSAILAKETGAEIYVNVERFNIHGEVSTDKPIDDQKIDGLREIHFKADMLDFISRVNSESVNILISQIDKLIIKSSNYHSVLAREILRVTEKGGIIFGSQSEVLSLLKYRQDYKEKVSLKFESGDVHIFEKK